MQLATWPTHDDSEINGVADVLRSGKTNYWTGMWGQDFEAAWTKYTGALHSLSCTNGTSALELAMHSLTHVDKNIGLIFLSSNAEVIVPCRTFIATASAVVNAGLIPVLADIDPKTLNVTVDTLEAARTRNTVAVIVVHYAGFPCDMTSIMAWANRHNIVVIEDCAHAHGARLHGQHVGTFGNIGTFSFCVGKIMSTGGEGGMVVSNNKKIHDTMAAYRDHGRYQIAGSKDFSEFKWTVDEFGSNLRMTNMQAVIGLRQLQKLPEWIWRRQAIAATYSCVLQECNGVLGVPPIKPGYAHSFYMYVARVMDRDNVMKQLIERGVPARLGGCPNIGREKAFQYTFGVEPRPCPEADKVGAETLALPINPNLTDEQLLWISAQLREVLR